MAGLSSLSVVHAMGLFNLTRKYILVGTSTLITVVSSNFIQVLGSEYKIS
jgi:hypothetical protein